LGPAAPARSTRGRARRGARTSGARTGGNALPRGEIQALAALISCWRLPKTAEPGRWTTHADPLRSPPDLRGKSKKEGGEGRRLCRALGYRGGTVFQRPHLPHPSARAMLGQRPVHVTVKRGHPQVWDRPHLWGAGTWGLWI
jgi:hypothetical protein